MFRWVLRMSKWVLRMSRWVLAVIGKRLVAAYSGFTVLVSFMII